MHKTQFSRFESKNIEAISKSLFFIEYTSFTFLHVSSISRRLPLEELTLLDHRGGDENIYIDMKLWSATLDITLIACS